MFSMIFTQILRKKASVILLGLSSRGGGINLLCLAHIFTLYINSKGEGERERERDDRLLVYPPTLPLSLSSSQSKAMLSLLSTTLLRPPPVSLRRSSKNPILMRGLLSSKRFGGREKGLGRKSMSELAKVDAFGTAGDAQGETKAGWGNGSSGIGCEFSWREVEAAINRSSKWLVTALFGLFILWKHDAESLWAVMGSVVNAWFSTALKRLLNHERPASALRSDPGMPSSHAQSLFYAAFFAVLSVVNWLGINVFTVTMGILTLAFGSYLSWLRISQQLHTIAQVLVGAALGSTCAITWFWMWHSFVRQAFIASIWIRIIVVLGSTVFCVGFLIYVIRHWLMDEQ